MPSRLNVLRVLLATIAGAGVLLSELPGLAAEKAVLKYGFFRESVSVPELATFAKTGKVSTSVGAYLGMAGKTPQAVRQPLTQEIKVNGVLLYRVLTTPVGELLLDRVSEVIHTPDNLANRQALRSALVMSALPDGNITLTEILENYPTPEVHVEGERLAEIYGNISRLVARLPKF